MHEDDRGYRELWKSQELEPMHITKDEVCARVHRHERNDKRLGWGFSVLIPLMVGAFVYRLIQLRQPWLIAGVAWGFAAFCYFVWISFRNSPGRKPPSEPCVDFLRRMFQSRRQWTVDMRRTVLSIVPAVVACAWGNGWLSASPVTGMLVLIAMTLLLGTVWLLMVLEARRLGREIEKLASQ
jgi:undecaprenyl pyrophosphate phosphatase UppP